MSKTEEKTTKTIKKSLCFEKSGEIISIRICLKNISPHSYNGTTIPAALDKLFQEAKKAIC